MLYEITILSSEDIGYVKHRITSSFKVKSYIFSILDNLFAEKKEAGDKRLPGFQYLFYKKGTKCIETKTIAISNHSACNNSAYLLNKQIRTEW